MKRPSKKQIKASVDALKETKESSNKFEQKVAKTSDKKSSMRIRKQGI